MRLALVLAALLVAPDVAEGATRTVTDFGDAPLGSPSSNQGPPGSLRNIVMKQAQPGDTIVFAHAQKVTLNFSLKIPQRLNGLTIDGSVEGSRAQIGFSGTGPGISVAGISIVANGVTIQNLVFDDSLLNVSQPNVIDRPANIKILNNLFTGARGKLDAGDSRKLLAQDNVFESQAGTMMAGSNSSTLKILDNTFTGAGPFSVLAEGIDNALLEHNTFESGRALLLMDGGRITDNTFSGGSLELKTVFERDVPRGVLMDANTAAGGVFSLRAGGPLEVAENTFTNPASLIVGCVANGDPKARNLFRQNAVLGGSGPQADCPRGDRVEIAGGQIQNTTTAGVRVTEGRAEIRAATITGSGGAGVVVIKETRAEIKNGTISGNAGAGVLVRPGSLPATVSRVLMGANGGPGIDRGPQGQSPSASPGAPKLIYDRKKVKLRGTTCPNCLVEIFESEEGAKLGNPGHGEGIHLLGVVRANGVGRFVFPAAGDFDCPASGVVTATSTRTAPGTSEFAADEPCSCVVSRAFAIDPESVPMLGFGNFGLEVAFENGSEVGEALLTDEATDEYPTADALGAMLDWEEFTFGPIPPSGDDFLMGFKVNVGYNSGTPASGPDRIWRYKISYDAPTGKGCNAVVTAITDPVP
jgi:hypothetical protein